MLTHSCSPATRVLQGGLEGVRSEQGGGGGADGALQKGLCALRYNAVILMSRRDCGRLLEQQAVMTRGSGFRAGMHYAVERPR